MASLICALHLRILSAYLNGFHFSDRFLSGIGFSMSSTCIYCSGTGQLQGDAIPCSACLGRGQVQSSRRDPNNTYSMDTCGSCGGSGKSGDYRRQSCSYCGGSGRDWSGSSSSGPPASSASSRRGGSKSTASRGRTPSAQIGGVGILLGLLAGAATFFFLAANFTFEEEFVPWLISGILELLVAKFWKFILRISIGGAIGLRRCCKT